MSQRHSQTKLPPFVDLSKLLKFKSDTCISNYNQTL